MDSIYEFNFCDGAVAVPDSELAIGTATRLLLEEEAVSIEGTGKEVALFAAEFGSFTRKPSIRWCPSSLSATPLFVT